MHVGDRDKRTQNADQDEAKELARMVHTHRLHLEERRAFENDGHDDMTDRSRHGDRGEGAQRIVPQDHLVREDDSGNGCMERRGYGSGDTTGDPHSGRPRTVGARAAHQRTQCRSQMRQRSVVTDRSTRSQRHEARQGRQQPRFERHAATGGVHDLDDVLRSLRTSAGHLQMNQPNHQAAERGNTDGRDHQQVGIGSHEPAAGGDEQPVVHQGDGVDEENGGKRCKRPGHESQNSHRENAHDESGFGRHQVLSGRVFMVMLDPATSGVA